MTAYLDKSFSVKVGGTAEYRDNWERTFGKAQLTPREALMEEVKVLIARENDLNAEILRIRARLATLYEQADSLR